MLKDDSKIKLKSEIIVERVKDSWILLNIDDGKFYELNSSAFLIIKMIKKNHTFAKLKSEIEECYESPSIIELEMFLKDLIKSNFIDIND